MMGMCHGLLNHSAIKKHHGCLPLQAIKNKIAMNIQYRLLCEHKFSFPWDKYPRVQLLDRILITC